ncbi:transposase family protein [Pseudonocardia sp. ICBG601]|uniref:transposase family protein n=1 Tax=Pseudonocardia sp. ICBG601 TaxID=2846759 RepID=UPI001CF6DB03|nr:transposase family protein [Pseudonocardia sp. ICBG601]
MYYTTGFRRDEIQDLAALVHKQDQRNATGLRRPWPPILGLFWSVVITLAYLRGNRVQWELAETYGVSQSTVSRAIAGVTPLLAQALRSVVPTAEELRADRQYIIDGTLLPCWSWTAIPGLWSGKHRTTGVVVQVAATLDLTSVTCLSASPRADGARRGGPVCRRGRRAGRSAGCR